MEEREEYGMVAEAFVAYLSKQKERNIIQLNGGSFFTDRMAIITTIRQGIPQPLFMQVKEASPFSEEDWSVFLDISLKSLQRYKKDKKHIFKSIHSEKIIELAEVTYIGEQVFASSNRFYSWLQTKSLVMGGHTPLDLLRDSYGKEMVIDELHRIDHGVFA